VAGDVGFPAVKGRAPHSHETLPEYDRNAADFLIVIGLCFS
jgi:hypothetical protein